MTDKSLKQNQELQIKAQAKQASLDKANVSSELEDYLEQYQLAINYHHRTVSNPIQVDELASKLAKVYEKFRRIIDWKEEHLVRRTAIERILKRYLLGEIYGISNNVNIDLKLMAREMTLELIRGGHFTNGRIAKDRIYEVQKILEKYIHLIDNNQVVKNKNRQSIKEHIKFYNWILQLAACEIEEALDPAIEENALINLMTYSVFNKLKIIPGDKLTDKQALIYVYVGVHKTLFNLDDPIIIFNLLKIRHPKWFEEDWDYVNKFTLNIAQIRKAVDQDLQNKYSSAFFRLCDKYDAAYLIIGDMFKELSKQSLNISNSAEQLFSSAKKLDALIEKVYMVRYKSLKSRLLRSAIYSTLSIFITSGVSFIIFEGPVAKLVHGHFSIFALLVDLLIPTILMFLLVIIIKPPKQDNLVKMKAEIKKILFHQQEPDIYELDIRKKSNYVLQFIFGFISLIAGTISMIFIYWVFKKAGVPWTSLYIDTVNVAMVVFAAMVIRHRSKEITVKESGSVIEFIVDLFYIPIAKIGQWFSNKWKDYNFVSVLFTVLVDTPFSALTSLIEDWRSFLDKSRSEIQ